MGMDENARVELRKRQADYERAVDDIKDGEFKTRKQLVYIDDLDVRIQKNEERTPWISFSICGAEKDNEKCSGDVLFKFSQGSKDFKRDSDSLGRFLKALGLDPKPKLDYLDEHIEPIKNKIFEAHMELRKGKYLNCKPVRFVSGSAEESGGDDEGAPF